MWGPTLRLEWYIATVCFVLDREKVWIYGLCIVSSIHKLILGEAVRGQGPEGNRKRCKASIIRSLLLSVGEKRGEKSLQQGSYILGSLRAGGKGGER